MSALGYPVYVAFAAMPYKWEEKTNTKPGKEAPSNLQYSYTTIYWQSFTLSQLAKRNIGRVQL